MWARTEEPAREVAVVAKHAVLRREPGVDRALRDLASAQPGLSLSDTSAFHMVKREELESRLAAAGALSSVAGERLLTNGAMQVGPPLRVRPLPLRAV